MIIDGKDRIPIRTAAAETGLAPEAIMTFIRQNIVEAERIADVWYLSPAGMKSLTRTVTRISDLNQTAEEKSADQPKKNHGSNGYSIHFTTKDAKAVYSDLATCADALGVPVRRLAYAILKRGVDQIRSDVEAIAEAKKVVDRLADQMHEILDLTQEKSGENTRPKNPADS